MVVFPNAKINLGLRIKYKRPDGYHEIESCFYPVALRDILEVLEVEPGHEVFRTSGIEVPSSPEENLVMKAYKIIKEKYHLPPLHIHLHKTIPMGAGLGGGSSDAAFALKLLNDMFSLGISNEQLFEYASLLGSDCAFFILNRPAIATGRGEILNPVSLDLSGYYITIIKPVAEVSTSWAYRSLTPVSQTYAPSDIIDRRVSEWKDMLVNDFEQVIFEKHPEIKALKERLYYYGADYASLTGSGSAVYGLFSKDPGVLMAEDHYFIWQRKL